MSPTNHVEVMAAIRNLRDFCARVVHAYDGELTTDDERAVICEEILALSGHGLERSVGPLPLPPISGGPCDLEFTSRLDDLLGDIEGRMPNP